MADLDDFFAKKDKKKKGKKFLTANTDVLATKLEETAKKEHVADLKAASLAMNNDTGIDANTEGNDEEWKVYEERKKDYSGLKIESLKIEESHQNDDDEDCELDENGERIRGKKLNGGPWSKVIAGGGDAKDEESDNSRPSTPGAPTTAEVTSGSHKSAYLPPHMRGSSASASSQPMSVASKGQRRNKNAPDISNEFNFPSLAAAVSDTPAKTAERQREGASFERVKSGGSQQNSRSSEAPKLSLDNKYSALGGN